MTDDEEDAAPPSRGGGRGCGTIGCLLMLAVLLAVGAGAFALGNALEPIADRYLWQPHDVVREYLAAYTRGEDERARRFLCRGIRGGALLDPGAPHATSASDAFVEDEFPYPRPGGQWAVFYGVNLPARAQPVQGAALVEREEDGWRICAVE